ncbi:MULTISPECIES: MMPL family transporter [Gordonia]|uniref:Membrane protein n=1 Tax=Gordonia alkanivorans CGMCC 6845 TaxID=1423140 RepID=W9DJB4_9ACTN|nr:MULTISPECIES: MMPL family transporter [Gordonia]AZZ83026.1 MMPL family transporter [Gordonia alkanivorans]ETA08649.1 membrane protein [Gordonia alkanivorans CGMCC 6845]MDH3005310.1 MMPL family transporter [Gordonia alkanivorans]MDH3010391.1 MMPL family transporter [Gordonia alkanivorans]MDH3014722.1 MMPL family transporter [Gordonia alkanivorans]
MVRSTRLIIAMPRRVLLGAFVLIVVCGAYGATAAEHLLAGGYSAPNAESARADKVLAETFNRGGIQVVLKLDGPDGVDISRDPTAKALADNIIRELDANEHVQDQILSVWADPALDSALVSRDRTSTLIIAALEGGEDLAPARAAQIEEEFTGERDGFSIRVGGQALVYSQVNEQTSSDLLMAEAIAIPITFLVLIFVFGGLIAAALPVGIGIISIILTFALLRAIGSVTDVSVFALNLTTALGLALAIDYTLLLLTRYREEVDRGLERPDAIVRTLATAGRTVAFSAVTVALSLSALVLFPQYFLRSFAFAGLGVVAVAAFSALIITPAVLMVLGDRIDALDARKPVRRLLRLPPPQPREPEDTRWYRLVQWVLRHALPVAAVVTIFLLVLGAPFLSLRMGFPDDRVLPESASSHAIQQEIRDDYEDDLSSAITIVVQGPAGPESLAAYTRALSQVDDVNSAGSSAGTFVRGEPLAPGSPDESRGDVHVVNVSTDRDPTSDAGMAQLDALRAVPAPERTDTLFTGLAATTDDTVSSIFAHTPWVLAIIAVATFVLLFLFTGSVVLPLKALALNILSLSATFGAMVWFFQEGHLDGLGTTATGTLNATVPVLLFCVAFGLSMDYEMFLLGRVREEWLKSDRTRGANDHAVALGLARTGRVITAAALLMSIVFAAIAASQVSFMRMFGVGLALAVVMDATLVRMFLVPAFMRLVGRANWWAPPPLRKLHDRFGLSEEVAEDLPGDDTSRRYRTQEKDRAQENSDDTQTGEVASRGR